MPVSGYVYVVTRHRRYTKQLKVSVASLRRIHPDMPVTVFTDADLDLDVSVVKVEFGDDVFRDRIQLLSRFPYDRNVYIDADFLVLSDTSSIFDLLDRFHFAAAHADIRNFSPAPGVPVSFPEVAGGTIVYKQCSETKEFFDRWLAAFDRHVTMYPGYVTTKHGDRYHRLQAPLRMALWGCKNLNFTILPPEWSCHNYCGYASDSVVLAQQGCGRNTVKQANEFLNAIPNRPRVYIVKKMLIWQPPFVIKEIDSA